MTNRFLIKILLEKNETRRFYFVFQYIYDEVSKTLEQSIAIVNIASNDMSKILPEPVAKPLIAQLVNHIGLTLQEQIITFLH